MTDRATSWSITINNPTGADEESISLARQKGWRVEGQLEKGAEGTPHYQLIVKTPQVRFSAMKKAFPRAHIEVARNVQALEQYVKKEETREGALPQTNDMYPSLQKLWDLLAEWLGEHSKWSKGRYINLTGEAWLPVFDEFIRDLILKGYVVETIAVNPQIRSAIKSYGWSIIRRSENRISNPVVRQTDRQTEDASEVDENLSCISI